MMFAYFFGADNRCLARRTVESEDNDFCSEVARRDGAANYCFSTEDVPVSDAIFSGGRVLNSPPPPATPTYDQARFAEYPPLGEQLDMLWHAMDAGDSPKIEPFYSTIKAIKDRHPKPSN